MAKPYTLRKSKSGIRIMTLSDGMVAQMEASPIDAVRLTLHLTFKAIEELTGSSVSLDSYQEERLSRRLNEPALTEGADANKVWHWITQGARARDARDMEELLRVTSAAAYAVGAMEQASRDLNPKGTGDGTHLDTKPSPSSTQKTKP